MSIFRGLSVLPLIFILVGCSLDANMVDLAKSLRQPISVEFNSPEISPTNATEIPVELTFGVQIGEEVLPEDLQIKGGTIKGNLITEVTTGKVYSFVIIPSGEGVVEILFSQKSISLFGKADKGVTSSKAISFIVDRTPPTVVLNTSAANPTNAASIPVSVVFNEPVKGLSASDFVLTNSAGGVASITSFSGGGSVYNLVITPVISGLIDLELPLGAITDLAGNGTLASNKMSIYYDATLPLPVIRSSVPSPTNLFSIPIEIDFGSTSVTGLDLTDFIVTNGTVTALAGAGTNYTLNLLTATDGPVTLQLPAGTVVNSLGNGNLASNIFSLVIDRANLGIPGPPLVINDPVPSSGNHSTDFVWTVDYTDAVNVTLSSSDITFVGTAAANCLATVTGNGNTQRTVTVSGCSGDGTVRVQIAAHTAEDAFGGLSPAQSLSNAVTVDNTGPLLSIAGPLPPLGNTSTNFVWTVSYGADASNIDLLANQVSLVGSSGTCASKAVSSTGNPRTVTLSGCTGDGTLGISISAGSAVDSFGNPSLAAVSSGQATVDNTGPGINIGTPVPSLGNKDSQFSWTVSYTGADALPLNSSFITLSGSTAGCVATVVGTDPTERTVNVSGCTGDGSLTMDINVGSAKDALGNTSSAATGSAVTLDNTPPTLLITGPTPALGNNTKSFEWEISYSGEDKITLEDTDISLVTTGDVSCVSSSLGGSGNLRTVSISGCSGNGTVRIHVAANTAQDLLGNQSLAHTTSTAATVDNAAPTLSFVSPGAGTQIVDLTQLSATGTCSEDNKTITFTPAAKTSVVCQSGTWSAEFDLSTQTGEEITITAATTDGAGNQGTSSRGFLKPQYKVKEIFNTHSAFAALRSDGSVVTWGDSGGGGNSSSVASHLSSGVVKIFSTRYAFAALKSNGSVVTWGDSGGGGDSSSVSAHLSSGVIKIFSNRFSFAALKSDGRVVTWGQAAAGGDSSSVAGSLSSGVAQIFSGIQTFAALKTNGSLVTWGEGTHGGDSSSVASSLMAGVKEVVSSDFSFAALKTDGSVVTWGSATSGGDSTAVSGSLASGVIQVISSGTSFAALKSNGSVVTWGTGSMGGNSSGVAPLLASGIAKVVGSYDAFTALKADGRLVTWGNELHGGASLMLEVLGANSVVKVFSTGTTDDGMNRAFAALTAEGGVVSWGSWDNTDYFGVMAEISTGVKDITTTEHAFAALKSDGRVVTWGSDLYGGNSSSVSAGLSSGVIKIFSTGSAFAALKADGSVVTWGGESSGGNSSAVAIKLAGVKSSLKKVFANKYAFAGLKSDGSVETWAEDLGYGGESDDVAGLISSGVVEIFESSSAFAALKANGSVVTWGDSNYGGDSTAVASSLTSGVMKVFHFSESFACLKSDGSAVAWGAIDSAPPSLSSGVKNIFGTEHGALAALKSDGSVVTWGPGSEGGDSSSVAGALSSGVIQIVGGTRAFAALKSDGSVVTWGGSGGGDSSAVAAHLSSGVIKVFSTQHAFAALKSDGSVVAWGDSSGGGNSSAVAGSLSSGVIEVFNTSSAFAALKSDGSVVTWGHSSGGGNSSSVAGALSSGVIKVFSVGYAFAALKSDGSVVTWGGDGGNSSAVAGHLSSGVVKVFSTQHAFAALKSDGSVVTWGNNSYGGDSSAVSGSLSSGVVEVIGTDSFFTAIKVDGTVVTWGYSSI